MTTSNKQVNVSFLAQGHVNQTIELEPEFSRLSIDDLIKGLNDGTYCTTIPEDGQLILTIEGTTVGHIVDVDLHLEYSEFENR